MSDRIRQIFREGLWCEVGWQVSHRQRWLCVDEPRTGREQTHATKSLHGSERKVPIGHVRPRPIKGNKEAKPTSLLKRELVNCLCLVILSGQSGALFLDDDDDGDDETWVYELPSS